MDYITKLPPTKLGHTAILVFVDKLSKMVHIVATTNNCTSTEQAELFFDNVVKHHGFPSNLISNRGSTFLISFTQELNRLMNINGHLSTTAHATTDRQTECVNRVFEDMLRHFTNPDQDNGDKYLGTCEFAINNSMHDSTKETPFFLNSGQHPNVPMSMNLTEDLYSKNPSAQGFATSMAEALKRAKKELERVQQRQAAAYNSRHQDVQIKVGKKVLLSSLNFKWDARGTAKLLPRYMGPFEILKRAGKVAYRLDLPEHIKVHDVFHVSLMKEYFQNGTVQPPPIPDVIVDKWEYEVEAIINHVDKKQGIP